MGAFSDFTTYAGEAATRLTDQPLVFEVVRRLNVPGQELFNYITDFSRLNEWISGAKKSWADDSNAEAPGEVGSVRVIQSPVGTLVRETVKAYEAPRLLAYSADDSALFGLCTDHLGVVTCEPHPDGGTVMCWQAYGRLPQNRAKAWGGKKLFQVALTTSMKSLERKFGTL